MAAKLICEEWDERGLLVHSKNNVTGYEQWKEYDDNKNCIYYKDSTGQEIWWERDSNANCTYYKSIGGFIDTLYEEWNEWDERGNHTHYRNSSGLKQWWFYNEYNKITHYISSYGFEYFITYDDFGNRVRYESFREGEPVDDYWYYD